jgi:hypothetical protein
VRKLALISSTNTTHAVCSSPHKSVRKRTNLLPRTLNSNNAETNKSMNLRWAMPLASRMLLLQSWKFV